MNRNIIQNFDLPQGNFALRLSNASLNPFEGFMPSRSISMTLRLLFTSSLSGCLILSSLKRRCIISSLSSLLSMLQMYCMIFLSPNTGLSQKLFGLNSNFSSNLVEDISDLSKVGLKKSMRMVLRTSLLLASSRGTLPSEFSSKWEEDAPFNKRIGYCPAVGQVILEFKILE